MTKRLHARSFRQTDAEWEETRDAAERLGVAASHLVRAAVRIGVEAAKADPSAHPMAALVRAQVGVEAGSDTLRKETGENGARPKPKDPG